jgi:N-methylhydantoinase B
VRLGCYGLAGGKAGQPFGVTVDTEGRAKTLGGLVDGEPLAAGQLVRVVTTGGGGWGDALEREPDLVRHDVWQGKVSLEAARDDYGVVLKASGLDDPPELDIAATDALRSKLRASRRELAMLDRGPGYERMVAGKG